MPQRPFWKVQGPARNIVVGSLAITLTLIVWLWPLAARGVASAPTVSRSMSAAQE